MKRWLTLSAVALLSFVAGAMSRPNAFATPIDNGPHAVVQQFGTVLALVEQTHVDPVERDKLLEGAIKGMVSNLDAHSAYMNAEEYTEFNSDGEGRFGGVGLEVEVRDHVPVIINPIEGSPAERAGLQSGDRILRIDGESTVDQPLTTLVVKMRGTPGTSVVLVIQRGSEPEKTITLVREQIQMISVKGARMKGDIAYLRVRGFQQHTHEHFLRALGAVRASDRAPLKGILLDLRNNTGGFVDQAVGIADEFLESGTIFTARHRGKIVEDVQATEGGSLLKLPLIVLVNEYSASASELLAGALQDHKRGLLVGALTFGKGSVQTIFDLPNGAGIRLTSMRYFTPAGKAIQAVGVTPDVSVPGPPGQVIRERDLEGALPPEDASGRPLPLPKTPSKDAGIDSPKNQPSEQPDSNGDAGAPVESTDSERGVTRVVPHDPTNSPDKALRKAHELLSRMILDGSK